MSIKANSSGSLSGKFSIPAGIPSGSKLVAFTGDKGSHGEAIFTGEGALVNQTLQLVTTISEGYWWWYYDPLAQTFMINEDGQYSAVELLVGAAGTSDVTVQIRTCQLGFPTQTILASSRLPASSLLTNGMFTQFNFDAPVYLAQNTEYAIVVLCDDATTAIGIAEMGKYDVTHSQWVTSQPYTVGVLLSSSNASTWTASQDADMTFKLIKSSYTQTSADIALGSVTLDHATDLMVIGMANQPTSKTKVSYQLTMPDGTTSVVSSGQPIQLANQTSGVMKVDALISGDANASPVVYPGVQVIAGMVMSTADYVTRAIPAGNNSTAKIVFDATIPSGASVNVYIMAQGAAAWTQVSLAASSVNPDGSMEFSYASGVFSGQSVQVKLMLNGTSSARPVVKNLQVVVLQS